MQPGSRTRGLDGFFAPRSVAVVGASDDPRKWGHWLARGALAGTDRRTVSLVNRGGTPVLGVPTVPALRELADPPELVVVTTPADHVRSVVEQGLDLGARWFVVITTGVGTPTSVAAEEELVAAVRARGGRLLGPNCMGVVDTASNLVLSWGDFPSGSVGLVSQSGNVGLELGRMLGRSGHGFSRFVSLGNQRDVDAADAIESLVEHDATRLIAAYIEDFKDGRRLARTFASAHAAGKPVLLLTVGNSDASSRAAASHTGAMVSALDVVDAMCDATGAMRLSGSGELVDTVQALLATAPVRGSRVAVVGDSGGQGAIAADTLSGAGLTVGSLSDDVQARLRSVLPPYAGTSNPVDLAGAGEADLDNYPRVLGLMDPAETDVAVLTGYFGDYGAGTPDLADAEDRAAMKLANAAATTGRPVVVHSMGRDTPALTILREGGVAVYERIEHAAQAIANAARWHAGVRRDVAVPSVGDASVVTGDDYATVRELMMSYGVGFPRAVFVGSATEALDAATGVGYPVALKAMGLMHKTEAGGVRLGIGDEAELRAAFDVMRRRTDAAEYAVEQMLQVPHSIELIMGARRDPSFGPVAMVGIGGTSAELLDDTVLALAPLDEQTARAMLERLRLAPLLAGWRGAPPVDLTAAAQVLVAVSRAACEHPELSELELNPVVAYPGGAWALDAAAALAPRLGDA